MLERGTWRSFLFIIRLFFFGSTRLEQLTMALSAKDPDPPKVVDQTKTTATNTKTNTSSAFSSDSPTSPKGKGSALSYRSYAQVTKGQRITTLEQLTIGTCQSNIEELKLATRYISAAIIPLVMIEL
ncbi:hypothetical protein BDB00DRAFT_562657 [Zychaea mexicana]|uniref:uncharacterized protein n=1 Tax=Zychaea mexicana TaxID=64656 RepID=UPI0022FE8298|nr:uncharacterized protein BDB00DRAFT_562657 [Zychaea mexicana]KAI9490211.1 hypothetical protein BDB00DRAFT_562657 [Zychaea mexicana]